MIGPSLPALYLLASMTACPQHNMPQVDIQFDNQPPIFDNTASTTQLSQQKSDTTFSHSRDEIFTTGGITSGKIKAGFTIGYKKLMNPQQQEYCVWVDHALIEVHYDPTVYIAREYRPGTCRYDIITQHELRHVATDIVTLQQYLPALQQRIAASLASPGMTYAEDAAASQRRQDNFSASANAALKSVMDTMEGTRMGRQQQIDTREEYLRLSNACPN